MAQKKFKIENLKLKKGNILLARVMESTRSGQLTLYQDASLVGQVKTQREGNNIRWFEVGQLAHDGGELEITSSGDINVVNALAVLDEKEWAYFQDKAQKLQSRIQDFDEKNTQQNKGTVTYQQINPTKYKVWIQNLTEPTFLVFSQTYDGLWKINGQSALPVYSLLNGFRIDKNGEYIVEFEPQKYVYPGLAMSIITIAIIIILLLKDKPRTLKI